MNLPPRIRIVEVAPRDGLQNEPAPVPVAAKIALIEQLAAAGVAEIEAGSFVSPRAVPRMADTPAVLAGLSVPAATRLSALVPNLVGYEAARTAGVREVAVFAAASESFSRHNINCSIADSLARFAPVLARAANDGVRARGYVSCVLGCPYEGPIAPDAVADVARRLLDLGCAEISLGDTIGIGTPLAARALVQRVSASVPVSRLALHCHDTYGQALANIFACLDLGIAAIDSSVAGLGGCPYAPGATGNVATEDVVYMLHGMGIETGIDLVVLRAAGDAISAALGRPSQSRAARALRASAPLGPSAAP